MRLKVLLILGLLTLPCYAGDKKPLEWKSGTLVDQAFSLEDAGCAGNVCGGTYQRTHYTIIAGKKLYVANRTGSRLDVTVNTAVRFAISGNTLYLMDAKGKSHDCHLEQERDAPETPSAVGNEPNVTKAEADSLIDLVSSPTGADISVDGEFVGNAPAKLHLKPGKYKIKVTMVGYKEWSREITALAGSQVTLAAALPKDD